MEFVTMISSDKVATGARARARARARIELGCTQWTASVLSSRLLLYEIDVEFIERKFYNKKGGRRELRSRRSRPSIKACHFRDEAPSKIPNLVLRITQLLRNWPFMAKWYDLLLYDIATKFTMYPTCDVTKVICICDLHVRGILDFTKLLLPKRCHTEQTDFKKIYLHIDMQDQRIVVL